MISGDIEIDIEIEIAIGKIEFEINEIEIAISEIEFESNDIEIEFEIFVRSCFAIYRERCISECL